MRNRQYARKSSISGLGRPAGGIAERRESGLIRRPKTERLEVETPVLTIPPLSAPGDRIDYLKVERLRAAIEANDLPIDARAIAEKLAVTGLAPLVVEPDAAPDEAPGPMDGATLASERRRTSRRPRKR
jgi:hypothetical protein